MFQIKEKLLEAHKEIKMGEVKRFMSEDNLINVIYIQEDNLMINIGPVSGKKTTSLKCRCSTVPYFQIQCVVIVAFSI
jgi:hypothetical protein